MNKWMSRLLGNHYYMYRHWHMVLINRYQPLQGKKNNMIMDVYGKPKLWSKCFLSQIILSVYGFRNLWFQDREICCDMSKNKWQNECFKWWMFYASKQCQNLQQKKLCYNSVRGSAVQRFMGLPRTRKGHGLGSSRAACWDLVSCPFSQFWI